MNKLAKICISLVILAVVAVVYFQYRLPGANEGNEGLYCMNDGVIYAQTRAMAEEGTFDISNFQRFATGDISRVGDKLYSNKPLGTSLAALPFYYLGWFISDHIAPGNNRIMAGQLLTGNIAQTNSGEGANQVYSAFASPFVAKAEDVAKVQILLSQVGDPGRIHLDVEIVKDEDGHPADSTNSGVEIPQYQIKNNWQYVTIPYKVKLQPGEKYWLVIKPFTRAATSDGYYNVMRGPAAGVMKINLDDKGWLETPDVAPFFKLYSAKPVAPSPEITSYQKDQITIFTTSLLSTISAILAVFLIFKILYSTFKLSFYSSWLTGLIFAFGTLNWKYSRVLFTHDFSSCLVLLALYLLFRITISKKGNWLSLLILGLVLGFSVFTYYPNLLVLIGVMIYLLIYYLRQGTFRHTLAKLGIVIGGLLPSVIGIMIFHYTQFGSVFATAVTYYKDFPAFLERGLWFTETYFNNWLMILWGRGDEYLTEEIYGIFYCVPVLIFALIGIYLFYRRNRPGAWLIIGTALASIIFVSFFFCVYGGGTHDYRYNFTAVVLLMIPLGFFIEKFLFRQADKPWDVLLRLLFWGTVFLSFLIHYLMVTSSQAHTNLLYIVQRLF